MGFQDEPVAENLYVTYLLGTFFELLLKSDSVHYLFLASNFYFYLLMYQICDTSILPEFDYYDNLVLESFEITPWPRTFTRLTCWELFGTPAEVWLVPLTNCCISLIRILYWTCFSGTIESSCWSPTYTNMRHHLLHLILSQAALPWLIFLLDLTHEYTRHVRKRWRTMMHHNSIFGCTERGC